MAELIGAKRIVYVKDVDGLYTADPAVDRQACLIPDITAQELMDKNLPDLPFDRELLRCVERSRQLRGFHLVNGLKSESLEHVFDGKKTGSVIRASVERNAS